MSSVILGATLAIEEKDGIQAKETRTVFKDQSDGTICRCR
mgnify:CR=1 FL=1